MEENENTIEAGNEAAEQTDGLDNSNDATQEPETTDNSEAQTNEPEQLLGKFKSQDELLKAYTELEKKHGQQSNELGELRKKAEQADELQKQIDAQKLQEANNKGFQTVKEYENHKELNKFVANAYRKHLAECDFPDEMVNLLNELEKSSANQKELIETIESQFSLDTIKSVAVDKDKFKGELENREQQALEEEFKASAQKYMDETVPKYLKEFENPAFKEIFGEAFLAFGESLQPDRLVDLLHKYVDFSNKLNGIQDGINKENTNATDAIAGVASTGGSRGSSIGTNLLSLSDEAAAARLGELI